MTQYGTSRPRLIQSVLKATAQRLPPAVPVRAAPVATRHDDVDLKYWRGWVPEVPRKGHYYAEDDQLLMIPTNQMEPRGANPQNHAWAVGTPPMWNHPNHWAEPFDELFTVCVPTWEQDYLIGSITAPDMAMVVVESVSYEVISGLGVKDLFEFSLKDPALKAQWEDMIIDNGVAATDGKYVFASDVLPLPLEYHLDRTRRANFFVKARGIVDINGNSNHVPGEILNPNANFRLSVQGYFAPLRRNVDSAPRPMDLGNMEFANLDEALYLEGR